ncbi:hypothetical protein B296_00023487 [Ensete ventricosum]|uniref:Uncharacterized protein n=1 Tax=Ensete ventricosum TaxID=4639 RepID=A0A426Z1B6_ENSVE|nr:hypothetical protein B296_00023487 [Ensete ventricosum]
MTMLAPLKVKLTNKDLKEISDEAPRDEVGSHNLCFCGIIQLKACEHSTSTS